MIQKNEHSVSDHPGCFLRKEGSIHWVFSGRAVRKLHWRLRGKSPHLPVRTDLLILLSDIDGLYSDDPKKNPDAVFIEQVDELSGELMSMGKSTTGSDVGTGGMAAKLYAARIATDSGSDMVIANGDHVEVIWDILNGEIKGTLFTAHKSTDFALLDYIESVHP